MLKSKYKKIIINPTPKKWYQKSGAKIVMIGISILLLSVGASYAMFTMVLTGNQPISMTAGTLEVSFEDSDVIELPNIYPMSDEKGLRLDPYTFTITNNGNVPVQYQIFLEEDSESTLDASSIKYAIKKNEEDWSTPVSLSEPNLILIDRTFSLGMGEEDRYQLKLWVGEKAGNTAQNQPFKARIVVDAVQQENSMVQSRRSVRNLLGSEMMNVMQNTDFVDPGVSQDENNSNGQNLDSFTRYEYYDGVTTVPVARVDTAKLGVYYIYYYFRDELGNMELLVRSVNVYKPGTNPITMQMANEEVQAFSNGLDISNRVIQEEKFHANDPVSKIVKYIVMDDYGNIGSMVKVVALED